VSNSVAYNLGNYQVMTAPTERYTVFSRGRFEFNDNVAGFAQVMFTKYEAVTNYGAGLQTQRTTAVVPVDNAFIPADLAGLLASRPDPTAPFNMEKLWTATGTSVSTYGNNIYQFTAGLEGKFGSSGWTWDVSGSTGESDLSTYQNSGGASFSRIQALLNSRSVTVNGQLVNVPQYLVSGTGGVAAGNTYILNPAYATATNDGGRSLPGYLGSAPPCPEGLNMFGVTELSASCKEFLQIHPKSTTKLEQNIVEANVQGGLFELPAGTLQLAAGLVYRDIDYVNSPSPANEDLVGSFGTNASAGYDSVKEIYGELLVPVLRDLPLIRAIDIGLGYRYSDYLSSGGVNTYKVDMDWKLIDTFRLRGGLQRAIRAPNVSELYAPAGLGIATLGRQDPCNANSPERTGPDAAAYRQLCIDQGVPVAIVDSFNNTFSSLQTITGGNPDLRPEKADTVTVGAVWSPRFSTPLLETFTASVDYYNIKMKDTIGSPQGSLLFQGCFSTVTNPNLSNSNEFCQAIVRTPSTGNSDRVKTPTFNLGGLRASGIDFQVDWGFGLGAIGLSDDAGRLSLNFVASRTLNFQTQANALSAWSQDYTGTYGYNLAFANNGARPAWKTNTNLGWSRGPVNANLNWYFVGKMTDLTTGPVWDPVNNMASYSRFDLSGGWQATGKLRLSAGISNLLDKKPLATSGGIPGNTDSGTYDTLGRRYFAGFDVKF
jgi:outer membrane receptor protein involved in Fe transport